MITKQEQTIGFIIAGGMCLTVINMTTQKDFIFALTLLSGVNFALSMISFLHIIEEKKQKEVQEK